MKKMILMLLSFAIFAVHSFAESENLSKGLELYNNSKYSQAKPYFEKIAALNNEETGEAYFYLAEIAYFTLADPKNDAEHERLLRLSIAKDYIPAITHLGGYINVTKVGGEIRDTKEGEKILLAGLEKFPNNQDIIDALGKIYDPMGITDKTVNFYEQLGAKGNSKAYLSLGYLYQEDKQYNLAEENFLKAANKNVGGSRSALADFYKSQKKYDLAEKYYLEERPEDAIGGLADLYIIQKKYDVVEKLFQDSGYDRQEIISTIADRAFNLEDYKAAEKYYLQGMKENPNSFYNQAALALSAEKAGDNSLAEEMYKKDMVSNLGSESAGDYVRFMLKQGKLAEVEKFAEENKGSDIETSIYGSLLSNYFDEKNVEGIKKYSQKLIDLKNESYRYEMGYAYYLEKNYSEATKNFLIAKTFSDFSLNSLYYLGMIEKEKGNMKEAKAYFLKVYKEDKYYSVDLLNELKAKYEKEGNTKEIKQIQGYIDEINNSN